MNETSIQNDLWLWLTYDKGYPLVVPNYTPVKWYEADLFGVTKAGLGVEFEIKISRRDFKADAKKVEKYRRLAAGEGPSRFYFVMPEDLVAVAEIPPWAGLIELTPLRPSPSSSRQYRLSEVRKAPRRNRDKLPEDVLTHMRGVFYYRFWRLRLKNNKLPEP